MSNWNLLRKDRLKHMGCGFIIALLALVPTDGLIAAALCGAAAEYKDKAHGTEWDWADLVATIIGGLIAFLLRIIVGLSPLGK